MPSKHCSVLADIMLKDWTNLDVGPIGIGLCPDCRHAYRPLIQTTNEAQ